MGILGLALIVPALSAATGDVRQAAKPVFAQRGYYFTFSRMPTYGLETWKQIVDCVHADGGNTVILWIGGGFRSRGFPETWQHNRDLANVESDFASALIDYAHTKNIAVLLGLTPFGYDGVNQMSLSRPAWRATGPDGRPAAKFGFHSWGYNLCPSQAGARQFMLDYARELCLDFYPKADGMMIESSDYAACHCKECGGKFYDLEFEFVTAVSKTLRDNNREAIVAVYPHYFTGTGAPGLGVTGARQSFDPAWTLFYTPHSAHPVAVLTAQARGAIWSDDAVARHTPATIRAAAQRARREGCTGYVPSLEVFTYVPTEPEEGQQYLVGERQTPFGFGWLKEGEMPYNELPARVNRIAYREYTRDPDLSDADFRAALGKELFGASATPQAVEDALFLQQMFASERTWCQAAPPVSAKRVKAMKAAGRLSEQQRAGYRAAIERARAIESRYRNQAPEFAGMHRVAKWVVDQWPADAWNLLAP